jgi:transposase InsO family protein
VRRTLDRLGVPKSTFYGWYARYRAGGDAALEDARPGSGQTWNRLPQTIRQSVLTLALERPELSARELAVLYTEQQRYFVSESSVYRLLKAHDLITSPAFVLLKAAAAFQHPTTAPNQLWQTDFTYLKVIGWGWFCLSTVLDDYSRYLLAWKLCTRMTAREVTATLSLALDASGLESAKVHHRTLSREPEQPDAGGRVHRSRADRSQPPTPHQAENAGRAAPAILPTEGRMTMNLMNWKCLLYQDAFCPKLFDDVQPPFP